MLDFGGPAMVKCAKVKSLPTIAFKIGDRVFPLAPDQYILRIDAGVIQTFVCTVYNGQNDKDRLPGVLRIASQQNKTRMP